MVEASKLWFEEACRHEPCSNLIHPWTHNCTDATATMLLSCIKGSYKFYAMVYILQILMRGKKLGKEEILKQFKMYLKSGIFGLTVGSSFVTLNCIFRKLFFSQFSYYRTVLLPCTLSGFAVYFEPPHRRVLVVNLFVNLVFEYWLRTLEMKGWLRRTYGRETLIFMLGSALFFYFMRQDKEYENKRTPIFWFFTPPRVCKEEGKPVPGIKGRSPACPHKGPCLNYVLMVGTPPYYIFLAAAAVISTIMFDFKGQIIKRNHRFIRRQRLAIWGRGCKASVVLEMNGTAKLFGLGCAMTMLRAVLPKILTPSKALKSLKPSHMKLGLFFGGYIGIYRLVTCLLCRANGKDSASYALPAGFLAGAAFRASPSTPIALAPITCTLQILVSWCYKKGMIPENWPLVEILYCLCQGLLFHARVMHEDVCPRYILNLMHSVTSNRDKEIQTGFVQKMLKFINNNN